MNSYQNLPPQERMVFIAKIYHNIWYDKKRYEQLQHLLCDWEEEPVKEAKFLNETLNQHGTEKTELC